MSGDIWGSGLSTLVISVALLAPAHSLLLTAFVLGLSMFGLAGAGENAAFPSSFLAC